MPILGIFAFDKSFYGIIKVRCKLFCQKLSLFYPYPPPNMCRRNFREKRCPAN